MQGSAGFKLGLLEQKVNLLTSRPHHHVFSTHVLLTSGVFCLDSAALLMKNYFTCLVTSKLVKQEVSCTVILPPPLGECSRPRTTNSYNGWAGALVQCLWEKTHVPKVVGSNPSTVYWMDIFSHLFVVKICNVCLKRLKINEKRLRLAHFFKKNSYNGIFQLWLMLQSLAGLRQFQVACSFTQIGQVCFRKIDISKPFSHLYFVNSCGKYKHVFCWFCRYFHLLASRQF